MPKTSNAVRLIDGLIGRNAPLRAAVARATLNAQVAQSIYAARTRAGLTQQQLARLVGTSQPVIARLEDADYRGHSLTMLQRIAVALEQRVELRLVPSRAGARRTAAA